MTLTRLPQPAGYVDGILVGAADRWQPTRCGVINAWQYAEEILTLHRGRLLLFGPNGSGKTMLVEMLWPYLLDTNLRPARLSTGGTDRGTLANRLTGYTSGEARTAYLWAEFQRRDSGQTFTIGCRLRVSANAKSLDRVWFTTDQQIDVDLSLLDRERRPTTPEALAERIGGRGRVWGGNEAGYRSAVRTRLFPDHTEESYDQLIDTILVVRQKEITSRIAKQGSTRAQAKELSTLLTGALPPLDASEIARAADGFERLDRRRARITELRGQQDVLRHLAKQVQRAARIQLHRLAVVGRESQTSLDGVTRAERKASEALDAAKAARDDLQAEVARTEVKRDDARAELNALKDSQAYRDAQQLVTLAHTVKQLAAVVNSKETTLRVCDDGEASARRQVQYERAELDKTTGQVTEALTDLVGLLREARLGDSDPAVLDDLDALATTDAQLARQKDHIAQVVAVVKAHTDAVAARDRAEDTRDLKADEVDTRREEHRQSVQAMHDHVENLLAELTGWAVACQRITVVWPDRLTDDITAGVNANDPTAVEAAVRSADRRIADVVYVAVRDVLDVLAARRRGIEADRDAAAARIDELEERIAQLQAGVDTPPEPPKWRADRTGRDGAALYRCIDFIDEYPGDNDVVETVLGRTGLLDAWLDGSGVAHLDDVTVRPDTVPPDGSSTLATVLQPDAESSVAVDRVAALLTSIALVDTDADQVDGGDVVIGRDGTWRIGLTVGRVTPTPAIYIGAAAQERRRRQQLAAAEAELGEVTVRHHELQDGLTQVAADVEDVHVDVKDVRAVDLPVGAFRDAHVRLGDAVDAHRQARAAVEAAAATVQGTQYAVNEAASRTNLPANLGELSAAGTAVGYARRLISTVRSRRDSRDRRAVRVEEVYGQLSKAAEAVRNAKAEVAAATRTHRNAEVRLSKLRETAGADAQTIQQQVTACEQLVEDLDTKTLPALRSKHHDEVGRAAKAEETLRSSTDDRKAAEQVRTAAFDVVATAIQRGLAVDADVTGDLPVDRIRDMRATITTITRQLEQARTATSDLAWSSARNDLADARYQAKEAVARFNMDPQIVTVGDGIEVLRMMKDGRSLRIDEAEHELGVELTAAESELGKAEEEAFRSVFTGTLRAHLADRLRTATAMVRSMNTVLDGIRTGASDVQVSLLWKVDPAVEDPKIVERFRNLLLRANPTDAERADMTTFLSRRIDQIEATADPNVDLGSWADRLTAILDYRDWHTFDVMMTSARIPTPTTFGTRGVGLSTGEHAIVLVLPLLAAVAAHYLPRDGEAAECPRLLVMDEVFPTVDEDNKRQLFGLMGALDLDYLMTSDKEWCTFDTVDGIAIHTVQKDGHDSFTNRFTWDGREKRSAPVHLRGGDSHPLL